MKPSFTRKQLALWLVLVGAVAWACGSGAPEIGTGSSQARGGAGGGSGVDAGGRGDDAGHAGSGDASGAGLAGDASTPPLSQAGAAGQCFAARATPLPARLAVSAGVQAAPKPTPLFVQDLFDSFKGQCGACHVDANTANFQVSLANFATKVDSKVLLRILATDPAQVMPPAAAGGKLASEREPSDPLLQLAAQLQVWLDAGRPRDVYYPPASSTPNVAAQAGYRMTTEVAQSMTNLGNCIPDKSLYATDKAEMANMDAAFAQMTPATSAQATNAERIGLPEHLSDTDLVTFESAALAKRGVVAFAPAYPLWTDDAGKLRHVRVPLGTSIQYDPKTRQFDIPTNTRFYKTFMREVTEADGVKRFRKLETRVVLSRPDRVAPDGTARISALFGTYVWNDDETDAVLLSEPLRDGTPFRDRLITVITDEVTAKLVRAKNPTNLSYALQDAKAIRHYAIPGSERCLDCHLGSPSKSFILGFLPVQIHRRAVGLGGVIEPTGPDELTQLERLVDFGLVSGFASGTSDAPRLEEAQGTRAPRNERELKAQGYLLGNCAHCHNPRGLPTVANPVLADALDFLPSDTGGVFQFPLERTSPRIFRGAGQNVPIPYITPSLMDYPFEGSLSKRKADVSGEWAGTIQPPDPTKTGMSESIGVPVGIVLAPWRSLIYRNVDTPFTYSDDFALYPHMPMDSPGHDCRAHQILSDWMVSIPATRKKTKIWEFASPNSNGTCIAGAVNDCDDSPQPYVEVTASDPQYEAAERQAEDRLTMLHTGLPSWFLPWAGPVYSRYDYCPDNSDIVDPVILKGGGTSCNPKVVPDTLQTSQLLASGKFVVTMPNIGVPTRPHFVVTDLTDTPGEYNPRRADWHRVLVEQTFDTISGTDCSLLQSRQDREKEVVRTLGSVRITAPLRDFATKELPLGIWKPKPQCNLNSSPTVSSYAGDNRPRWMDQPGTAPAPDAHVYTQSPGEAVFNMVCINCHGAKADSRGRMAENLMTMTGGTVRVANLRDGLFGPVGGGSANYRQVFASAAAEQSVTAEDMAARYLSWMALGGTKAQIPPSILSIVGNTQVLGVPRNPLAFASLTAQSANMLATVQELCKNVLPLQPGKTLVDFYPSRGTFSYESSALIDANGDAEMWQRLCSIDNRAPIRAVTAVDWTEPEVRFKISTFGNLYRAEGFPTDTPIGDHRGQVRANLDADNLLPWCIVRPASAELSAIADSYATTHAVNDVPLPFCPASLVSTSTYRMAEDTTGTSAQRDLSNWATRGAMNAGIAVFLYLQRVVADGLIPKPAYDRCELLTQ